MNDFDRRLGESLKTVSSALREGRAARAVGAHADFRRRLKRRRVTRFASLAGATAVVAVAAAIAATQGASLFENTRRGDRSVPAPAAGTYIRVGENPVGVSVAPDAIWVASSEGTITRVNPATNRSTAVINVQGEPSDVALTDGVIWYSDSFDGTVKRLSMESLQNFNFIGTPLSIGSQGVHIDLDVGTQGTVWAASHDFGALIAIDADTGEEIRRVLTATPTELAIGPGGVWALIDGGVTLIRYDFVNGRETMRMPVGDAEKTDMAASASAVYLAEAGGTVVRIDAATGEVTHRATVAGDNPELALGRGALWVTSDREGVEADLDQLDLADLSPMAKPREFVGAPTDVSIGGDSVWISDTGGETVVRIKIPPR